jgi:hypothetical protein
MNTFSVTLSPHGQASFQNAQVSLQTTMLDMAMGTDSVTLQPGGNGSFSGQGTLSMSGHWRLRVVIHTADHALHEGQFQTQLG